MACKRVAIGGTFACDDTLAVPLLHLINHAVWNVDVDVQWLRYGSLTDFNEWSTAVLYPARPVDLVLLLIRLSDLEVMHPELQNRFVKGDTYDRANVQADGGTEQLMRYLGRYDSIPSAVPLVVHLCPCPPTSASRFKALECMVRLKAQALKRVSVQTSGHVLSLFKQQYSTEYYDAVSDKRQHSPYTQAMLNVLSLLLCRQICQLFRAASNSKKVIVLDCDNTLWGGAVAEVGPKGVDLGTRFLSLQRFVVAQQQRGMLLALCSKNIRKDVLAVFTERHDELVLDLNKHVVATKINWHTKSSNIMQIAQELSLGLDSFIFIDDNPLECNEVKTALPSVSVIPLPADFNESALDHEWVFDHGLNSNSNIGTQEDGLRTQFYQLDLQREKLWESTLSHQAFLSALDVKIVFEELSQDQERSERSTSFTRVLQLHHRTNQLTTATTFAKRLEESTLYDYVSAFDNTVVCAHVTDRFGHYGLVSTALCRHARSSNVLRVDSLLLSCRALNRGVEHAMVRKLSEIAARTRATVLEIIWEPTERNQPAHAFFSALSDMKFVVKTDQLSNVTGMKEHQISLSHAGSWMLSKEKGSQVTFLQTDGFCKRNVKTIGLKQWRSYYIRFGELVQNTIVTILRWILSLNFIISPWLTCSLQATVAKKLAKRNNVGMMRVPLRDRGSLEQFLCCALLSAKSIVIAKTDNSDVDDEEFRRKARHQTKMALVNYFHKEASRVIWSANRPHTHDRLLLGGSMHEDEASSVNGIELESRLQLVCDSPQCSTPIQRESRCAFKRCRTCCYRMQRLVARSLRHANMKARQSALNALQAELAATISLGKERILSDPVIPWCEAHCNKRRRGETFK
ncbi:hypothetical protein CCR75_002794 [Bremia lactucae]|uniref:Uncharacterized protein n=1 Tax=Bremia lactucae TaxID=4779 RepID=A0A976FQS3_BRELC|nr:hypothetical protein CCR75_002794 [Bremia lactucae]